MSSTSENGLRPCFARHPDPTTNEDCPGCKRFRERDDFRKLWTKPIGIVLPVQRVASVASLPCIHEGAVLEWCNSCKTGDRHVRSCDLHERCTRSFSRADLKTCANCSDYRSEPLAPLPIKPDRTSPRHLLYHVYPVKGNGIWQLNLDRLRMRLDLFTGRRSIAITADSRTDEASRVRDYFAGERVDWIETSNDCHLREMKTWPMLWETLGGETGAVFYGHAKGVTRPCNPGTTIHRWANLLYRVNLDHWPVIESLLKAHPLAGGFRKAGKGFNGSASAWHFSGSFYWLCAESVGNRWRTGDANKWYGVESWPGVHFKLEDGGCHFGGGVLRAVDLYKMSNLARYEAEYEAWKSDLWKRSIAATHSPTSFSTT